MSLELIPKSKDGIISKGFKVPETSNLAIREGSKTKRPELDDSLSLIDLNSLKKFEKYKKKNHLRSMSQVPSSGDEEGSFLPSIFDKANIGVQLVKESDEFSKAKESTILPLSLENDVFKDKEDLDEVNQEEK